jgi:hypothetical protein
MVLLRKLLTPDQLAQHQAHHAQAVKDFDFEYIGAGHQSEVYEDAFSYPEGFRFLTEDKETTERYRPPDAAAR